MIITIPWPPRELSPNARTHWAKKAKTAKAYKAACWALAMQAGVAAGDGPITLGLTFYKPSSRRMDLDNMLASVKHGIDGIALALGVDDSRFGYNIRVADEIGGYIVVEVANVAGRNTT